ncbi:unnamed protein product [Cylicocyclus nassatus]|uniref:EGF-like domain-containing protein n=1 Tax=Cylicocyclus nassatus TaxID=53992 RepID=A0AA36M7Z2_CYLNA|nr:unnamed protein product [Cylicocyclus nassatus]
MFTVLALLISAVVMEEQHQLVRVRRQTTYYICGMVPNRYYSPYPCNNYQPYRPAPVQCCTNGGRKLNIGCTYDYQVGYCYNGERSQMRCLSSSVCSGGQTCINGLCCRTTGNEWQNACAGQGALASCTNGSCGEFVCTTSNYCCECEFGRTSGLCSQPGKTSKISELINLVMRLLLSRDAARVSYAQPTVTAALRVLEVKLHMDPVSMDCALLDILVELEIYVALDLQPTFCFDKSCTIPSNLSNAELLWNIMADADEGTSHAFVNNFKLLSFDF